MNFHYAAGKAYLPFLIFEGKQSPTSQAEPQLTRYMANALLGQAHVLGTGSTRLAVSTDVLVCAGRKIARIYGVSLEGHAADVYCMRFTPGALPTQPYTLYHVYSAENVLLSGPFRTLLRFLHALMKHATGSLLTRLNTCNTNSPRLSIEPTLFDADSDEDDDEEEEEDEDRDDRQGREGKEEDTEPRSAHSLRSLPTATGQHNKSQGGPAGSQLHGGACALGLSRAVRLRHI